MFCSSLKRSFEKSPNGSPDHLPAAVSFPVTSLPVSFSLRFSFLSQTLTHTFFSDFSPSFLSQNISRLAAPPRKFKPLSFPSKATKPKAPLPCSRPHLSKKISPPCNRIPLSLSYAPPLKRHPPGSCSWPATPHCSCSATQITACKIPPASSHRCRLLIAPQKVITDSVAAN